MNDETTDLARYATRMSGWAPGVSGVRAEPLVVEYDGLSALVPSGPWLVTEVTPDTVRAVGNTWDVSSDIVLDLENEVTLLFACEHLPEGTWVDHWYTSGHEQKFCAKRFAKKNASTFPDEVEVRDTRLEAFRDAVAMLREAGLR